MVTGLLVEPEIKVREFKKHHKWSDADRDIVRLLYRQNGESVNQIAQLLNCTFASIKGEVQRQGLAKKTGRKSWDENQDEQLRDLIGRYAPGTVARKMNRSVNSVVVRSKRLGIHRRSRDGWYTKSEVMEICGVDHKRVQQWIDSGILKASYHNGRTPGKSTGLAMWHIDEADLKSFIIKYRQELNGRNVDLIQIINILIGFTS